MWQTLVFVAGAWLRVSASSCDAGQCLPEEVGAQLASEDSGKPAVGLVQTSLHYKLREQRVAPTPRVELLQTNLTITRIDPVNVYRLQTVQGYCPLSRDLGIEVPWSLATATRLRLFQFLGLVKAQPHCGPTQQNVLTQLMAQGANVAEQNRFAWNLALAWGVFAVCLVLWSFFSVAQVPRKGHKEDTLKSGLANDTKAYERGIMNYISLGWVDELMGRYGKLSHGAIDDKEIVCNRQDDNYEPYVLLKKYWEEEVRKAGSVEKASMGKALFKTIGLRACVVMVCLKLLESTFGGVVTVMSLNIFLSTLEDHETMMQDRPEEISYLGPTVQIIVLIWGVPMIFRAVSIIATLVEGHYTQICASGLASVVFNKALRMPASTARSEQQAEANGDEAPDPLGQHKPNLVQLLNVDIVDLWGGLLHDILAVIAAPVSIACLLTLMIHQIDYSATVGATYTLPVMLLLVCSTAGGMYFYRKYQACLDTRMKWLTETMISIRTIKALAWERLSLEKLVQAREGEIANQRAMAMMAGMVTAIAHTMPWGVLLITMWFVRKQKGSIPAYQVMIVQRIIGSLLSNISQLVTGINRSMTVPNSFNRIKRFLAQPDRPQGVVRQPALQSVNAPALRVMGSFTFGGLKPALKDLDVAIPKGELVGVIGKVGSGKSSFLQAIIGDLYPLENAFVEAPEASAGHVAYCAQVPWIFEGTLRENVIMTSPLQQDRYYRCVYAAGLASDLQILPGGDQVTIGSFGIRLSGGQRARVALARAAYMEAASLVLIDDPFASVDGPTGEHIFTQLVTGPVLRDRTRIVVTQPEKQRLQHFDRLLLFEDGCIVETGPPAEVMETDAFKRIAADAELLQQEHSPRIEVRDVPSSARERDAMALVKKANEEGSLLREEEVREDITWSTFWWWVKNAGMLNLFMVLCSILLQVVTETRESLTVAVWVDVKVIAPEVDDTIFMSRLAVVVVCCCVCIIIAFWLTAYTALTAARTLHNTVMTSLLKAPVDRFFDKQPVGRLINRLSYDMKQVDETFVMALFAMSSMVTSLLVTQGFVLSVMPRSVALLSTPVYAVALYFVYLYRGTAVPLVFHSKHSLSSLQDLQAVVVSQCVAIRANGMLDSFMVRYNHYSQSVIRSQYLIYYVCRAWAQSRVFLCFGILCGLFGIGGLWGGVPMGMLATCITFAYFQMGQFESLCMTFTVLLNVLNALQRLVRYVDLPAEAACDLPGDFAVLRRLKLRREELVPLQLRQGQADGESHAMLLCIRGGKPLMRLSSDGRSLDFLAGCGPQDLAPASEALAGAKESFMIVSVNSISRSAEQMARELCTPPAVLWVDLWNKDYEKGMSVHLEDISAGYGNAKSVLHGVSLEIAPRTKCAFVGKTGCGKSTTLLCILRFLEPRCGRIRLGGNDTSKLGLRALRSIVGLVPQDPTVFEGTIRFNIDPFGEIPDARIWEAVQSVQLMPYIRTLPDGIDSAIDRDGSNISFGQKQLLSLARMVVRQPPILLLDECTSALDPVTQEAAQKTILKDFPRTTTIAVAHRLETILDFDQIVVFEQGKKIEEGTVAELRKLDGHFAHMLKVKQGTIRS